MVPLSRLVCEGSNSLAQRGCDLWVVRHRRRVVAFRELAFIVYEDCRVATAPTISRPSDTPASPCTCAPGRRNRFRRLGPCPNVQASRHGIRFRSKFAEIR
jgi:hypothetical protein